MESFQKKRELESVKVLKKLGVDDKNIFYIGKNNLCQRFTIT